MANELTLSATLDYADSESADELLQVVEKIVNVSTKKYVKAKQSIGTSEEAIGLGEVTSLGWAIFINRDSTNFITLKTATSGTIFARLNAGEFAMFRFGSGVTAPFATADTAAVQLEYMIVSS